MGKRDPVEKAFVNVSLTGGVNKKRDAHQLRNGELLTADNVIYSQVDGQICKRNGFAPVTPQGAPFQGGPFKAIGIRDNVEPLILGQNTLNRYNVSQNLSTSILTPTQGRLEVSQVMASSGLSAKPMPPSHASCATDGNQYVCVTWCEPNSTNSFMYYGVQDITTGNWIISPKQFSSTATTFTSPVGSTVYSNPVQSEPMVRYANGSFFLFWLWAGTGQISGTTRWNATIMCATLPLTNLAGGLITNSYVNEFFTSGIVNTRVSPTPLSYDVHFSGTRFAVATMFPVANSNGTLFTGTLSGTTFTPTGTNQTITVSGSNNINRVSVRADGPTAFPFLVGTSGSLQMFSATAAGYQTTLNPAIQTVADCMWSGSLGMGVTTSINTASRASVALTIITTNTIRNIIGATLPVATSYAEVLSRLFTNNIANKVYCWVGASSPSSDSIYNNAYLVEFDIVALTGMVIARALYLSNQHITGGDKLRGVDVLRVPNSQRYFTMLSAALERTSDTTGAIANGTLNRVLFDFAPARQVQMVSLPTGGVMIAGAYPLYYDGNDVVEAGFSTPPSADKMQGTVVTSPAYGVPTQYAQSPTSPNGDPVAVSLVGGTSAVTTSGNIEYYYVICFVRRDSYGNVYRSAPSSVITVPVTFPNAYNVVQFPAYQANGGGNVQVEFYRSTQNTPGTYYRIGVVPNNTTFIDFTPDGSTAPASNNSVTKNITVYTNSGELPNDPPPAIHHMVVSENRAYLIPADNRNVVWYSKQFSPGRTVEFSAALTLSEGLNSGAFSALAVLDSNLIIFKNDQILFTYGNGPDNTGQNGAFAPFQKIASDVGCIDAASVAVIPEGVVFKSRRGIEMLTRSLQVIYIGVQVENLVASIGPLASVVCMPMYTELRFIPATAGQQVLTYDYGGKRWSTFSNMAATQALNVNNDYWWISADGTLVNKETLGAFFDNGQPIVMTLETPEIPTGAGGIQGWGRVYRMALLGDFYSAHTMNVSFAYDHQTAYTDTTTFTTTSGLINGDAVYQFRCSRLPRSVMQTLKLKFQDSGVTGQSCAISDLALEVGSKSGLAKLPPAKTV